MAAYLRDLGNTVVSSQGVTNQAITQTTTGANAVAGGIGDFVSGDGLCNLIFNLTATSLTAITCQVQQSTLTNSGFADISGASVSASTDGVYYAAFQRSQRYLKAYYTISGTTAFASCTLVEQLKSVPY